MALQEKREESRKNHFQLSVKLIMLQNLYILKLFYFISCKCTRQRNKSSKNNGRNKIGTFINVFANNYKSKTDFLFFVHPKHSVLWSFKLKSEKKNQI